MNPLLRRLLPSVVLSGVLPLLVYLIVRPHTGSDAVALLLGAAVPLLVTVVQWLWRRRVDPVGVLSLAAFGVVALALWLTGGDALVVKLHDAIVTGPVGAACIVSALIGHPLLLLIRRAGGHPADPAVRRVVTVMTFLLGVTLVVHALLVLVLALTLPTTTFLVVRPVGWLVIAAGLTAVFGYRTRARTRLAKQPEATTELTPKAAAATPKATTTRNAAATPSAATTPNAAAAQKAAANAMAESRQTGLPPTGMLEV